MTSVHLTKEQKEQILQEVLNGSSLQAISEKYSITKQRVYQIVRTNPQYQEMRAMKRHLRAQKQQEADERKARRKASRESWVHEISKLWNENMSLKDMSSALKKSPHYLAMRISLLRKTYPELFPYRRRRKAKLESAQVRPEQVSM